MLTFVVLSDTLLKRNNWSDFEYLLSMASSEEDIPLCIESYGFKEADEYLELWRQKRHNTTSTL